MSEKIRAEGQYESLAATEVGKVQKPDEPRS
jgi:hypothetical protein